MSRVVVTGATGTIGGKTARKLLDAGADIRLGVRDTSRVAEPIAAGAEAVELDFEKPETFAAAFEGVTRRGRAAVGCPRLRCIQPPALRAP